MDLPWGDERTKQFITNVGLITSRGPYGDNVMAAEWTHHVSYNPGLIAVCIRPSDATHANIEATKEFGVNLCSSDLNGLSGIAGGNSGKNVDKIKVLKEFGFKFFKGKKIEVLMIEGALINLECKLFKQIELGDHTTFVGEVVKIYPFNNKKPLAYYNQKYLEIGSQIQKPPQEELDRISKLVEKYKKKT